MKWWKTLFFVALAMILIAACMMIWRTRSASTTPAAQAAQTDVGSAVNLFPGGAPPKDTSDSSVHTNEELSASDISEGKRLFKWMNCNTCHANGGGAIGPSLMDDKWIYGSEPRSIYHSILEGRPNGMPSFRGKIPDKQVWQLVAYVRSLSGQVPMQLRQSRGDSMSATKPETLTPPQKPKTEAHPEE